MESVQGITAGNWLSVLSMFFYIACFYFTLTFFQHVRSDDKRLAHQSKIAAVVCLAPGLLIPALYSLYTFYTIMR
ncbi:hypothetical protein [Sporosarcina sp. Te-1]|uniref:hypothetical protein n=1 Tax=Sporosarcina sp. Te-1 TaxID=2818390 RepID=UPI001A9EAFCA|nr:hypothetical protein [Sporosarcina sp. Te-1]QTD43563.1 hypothetical protein J3U78_04625 [Sporosarcina sp. Te-1]